MKELSKSVRVKHVTLMEPVESRQVNHVVQAMDTVLTRMRFMGISITRIHSDRAKELLAKRFRTWISQRNLVQTYTAGDDPQSNGHCESEVNQLKRRTRLLLHTANQDNSHWPQAMRYATEERLRNQMKLLGCPTQKMIPYNADVLVKRKRWHDQGNLLATPFVEAKLLCHSPDMTSGWLVQTKAENHVMHAREAIVPDPMSEHARIQLEEEHKAGKPKHRIWGKQSPPGQLNMKLPPLPRLDRGGEPSHLGLMPLGSDMDFEKDLEREFEKMERETGGESGLLVVENHKNLFPNDEEDEETRRNGEENVETSEKDEKHLKGVRVPRIESGSGGAENVETKNETWENLESYLGWMHQNTIGFLQDLVDRVPTNGVEGEMCGSQTEWLIRERERLEFELETIRTTQKERSVRLCSSQVVGENKPILGDVLQTVTVPLNEVRAEIGDWKEAMMKEYTSLVHETRAIEPVKLEDLDQESVEFVPGKLVTVRKAGPEGGKKKCRAVVCGNLLQGDLDPPPGSPYASGADGILIRAALSLAVERRWGIATTDIRTAFLHAPRPTLSESREVIVVPPKILVSGGVCSPNERWRVHNALYGFTSSPAHWAVHRDKVMSGFEWSRDGSRWVLSRSEEGNLWKIMKCDPNSGNWTCEGHVIVYVDDIMVMACDDVRKAFFDRLQQEWKCSEIETVNRDSWVRFCGFELKTSENGNGLMVGQKSYTMDLLKRHKDLTPKSYPMPKGDVVGHEEENPTVDDIRKAQGVTGELLWLAGRSRPDISYAVSCMGRGVLKRPKWVQRIGRHVLGFLMNTPDVCLLYHSCRKDHGFNGNLQVPRHERLLEAFADISYAPEGDRSHQGIIICASGAPIQWEATRQAFHTMSTSESELVGYCEATTMLKSAEALMKVLHGPFGNDDDKGFEKVIYGDNTSALSILMNPDGGWRTRHLRLRSSCLRELLRDDPEGWKIRHQRGHDLPADMLTKPIVIQKEWAKFWCFLGFHVDNKDGLVSSLSVDNLEVPPTNPSRPEPLDDDPELPEVSKEWNETKEGMVRIRAAAVMTALAAVAAGDDAGTQLAKACAAGAAALVKWFHDHNVSSDDRPKEVCLEGWEEEETKRTMSLQENDKKNQDARGDEPAMKTLPRENEPGGGENSSKENELGELRLDNQSAMSEKEKESGIRKVVVKKMRVKSLKKGNTSFVEALVAANSHGSAQQVADDYVESHGRGVLRLSGESSTYHCPSGCPFESRSSSAEAMSSSNGPSLATGVGYGSSTIGWPADEPVWPWLQGKYLYSPPVKSQDSWSFVQLEGQQYWVGTHHTHRLRLFHPVHRNQPVQANQLHSKRITVKFEIGGTGQPERLFDHWDRDGQERGTGDGKRWCGYTFFEMKDTKKDANKMDREKMDHRDEAHEEPGRSSGSQVVNVYMDGGASRVEVHRPFNCENRLDRESIYLKGHGKGNDHPHVQEMTRRGYIQGPVTRRGRDAMAPTTTSATMSSEGSENEWAYVTGE